MPVTEPTIKEVTGSIAGGGTGDVVGPGSSTTNALAKYTDATGLLLANSGAILDGSNNLTGINDFTMTNDFRITAGQMAINNTISSSVVMQVGGSANPLAGVQQKCVVAELTATSAATTRVCGLQADVQTQAASFTAARVEGVCINAITAGAGSTITRAMGLLADPQTAGTNNATICDNTAFTGDYFIHSSGSNPSEIEGNLVLNNQFAVNNSINSSAIVHVGGSSNPLAGVQQNGVIAELTATSAGTTRICGLKADVQTQAASFTASRAEGVCITPITAGAGSTITRAIGLLVEAQTAGTNNATITDNTAFTGTFFLNQSGTQDNTLDGTTFLMPNLPTGDPTNTGQLWNDSGTLKVSA